MIAHRPDQTEAISTEELAAANGLELIRCDGVHPLEACDYYLITGAGILPEDVVADKKIINVHPGIIPSARGLDAFKWSIYEKIELGVTLHFIDKKVDEGEVISIIKTPVY
ncbi:MAG: hypothetical protein LBH38_00415, partial [Holosporales bacterium]|nr:hypothetical protein [Holosporales bacterium]